MDEKKQAQKEFFEEFAKVEKSRRPKALFQPRPKNPISLPYEHLIVIAIAFIISVVISFSFGVERGTHMSARKSAELLNNAAQELPSAQVKETEEEAEAMLQGYEAPASVQEDKLLPVYTIQVASCRTKEAAEKEALRLNEKGFKAFVISSGKYYIVCAGEFKTKDKANPDREKLHKLYSDCFVRKR